MFSINHYRGPPTGCAEHQQFLVIGTPGSDASPVSHNKDIQGKKRTQATSTLLVNLCAAHLKGVGRNQQIRQDLVHNAEGPPNSLVRVDVAAPMQHGEKRLPHAWPRDEADYGLEQRERKVESPVEDL